MTYLYTFGTKTEATILSVKEDTAGNFVPAWKVRFEYKDDKEEIKQGETIVRIAWIEDHQWFYENPQFALFDENGNSELYIPNYNRIHNLNKER
jgi:hypothetical protein